ncbi:MAG: head-tail joining protein [Thiobacillaceae bacterium]
MAFTDSVSRMDEACLRVFGREIIYLPETGGAYGLTVILEEGRRSEEASPGVYAVAFASLADFSAPPVRGDHLTATGATYRVVDVDVDGEGGVRLTLHKV